MHTMPRSFKHLDVASDVWCVPHSLDPCLLVVGVAKDQSLRSSVTRQGRSVAADMPWSSSPVQIFVVVLLVERSVVGADLEFARCISFPPPSSSFLLVLLPSQSVAGGLAGGAKPASKLHTLD